MSQKCIIQYCPGISKSYEGIAVLAVIYVLFVYILFVYIYTYHNWIHPSIYHKVNCQWGDWIIGDCSQTCGEGTRTNTRAPKLVAEHGGEECNGPSSIAESCQLQNCTGTNARLIHLVTYKLIIIIMSRDCLLKRILYTYRKWYLGTLEWVGAMSCELRWRRSKKEKILHLSRSG